MDVPSGACLEYPNNVLPPSCPDRVNVRDRPCRAHTRLAPPVTVLGQPPRPVDVLDDAVDVSAGKDEAPYESGQLVLCDGLAIEFFRFRAFRVYVSGNGEIQDDRGRQP